MYPRQNARRATITAVNTPPEVSLPTAAVVAAAAAARGAVLLLLLDFFLPLLDFFLPVVLDLGGVIVDRNATKKKIRKFCM